MGSPMGASPYFLYLYLRIILATGRGGNLFFGGPAKNRVALDHTGGSASLAECLIVGSDVVSSEVSSSRVAINARLHEPSSE